MLFVPPSMPALDLLEKMQATRIHLALVVDEYGGTDGLVSMEDIVEQIVGDIADEHDEDELPAVVRENDGSFVADARASLEDVTAAVGVAFNVGDAAEEVDTIGGYLMSQVGRLPLRGELVAGPRGLRDRGAGFRSAADQEGPHPSQQERPHRARPRRPPPLPALRCGGEPGADARAVRRRPPAGRPTAKAPQQAADTDTPRKS